MDINFLIEDFKCNEEKNWIVWNSITLTYGELLIKKHETDLFLLKNGICKGQTVALVGDFTPNSIAFLLSLISNDNIIVPLSNPLSEKDKNKLDIAEVEWVIEIDKLNDTFTLIRYNVLVYKNSLYKLIQEKNKPGLVLFSSGTSGNPKAAVHNFELLLNKFKTKKKSLKTINFLLFDHWGGLNTLFHTLSNSALVLSIENRNPELICKIIQEYQVELLPASPSFINLLLLSDFHKNYNLNSLKLITYGTEPMPQSTLRRAIEVFPNVKFLQTYGLIELGVLSSKSKDDGSLWVKLGGEGFQLRVVNNLLEIKSESAMLGYINAPSPFTKDGFFMTGDLVEQDGEYYKILGRQSELINVGGEKVYPQEVENIILQFPNVQDVMVYSEKNAFLGSIVCAKIIISNIQEEEKKEIIRKLKIYCKSKLSSFMIPVKIEISSTSLYNERFKKKRLL
jgi:long-chain acyl-CoA synthetase